MQLNEEQTAAVEHPIGEPACLIAGAGSGKTRVLTERVRWLIAQGVPPRRILAITFTNKAANELVDRLGLEDTSFDIPKVSTIHSLALAAIRRDSVGFGLQHKVTPLDDYDQTQMLRKIVEREVDIKEKAISLGSYVYTFKDKIGFHRSRGLGFSAEYTEDVHERALVEHAGYHALDPMDLSIWKAYEEEKKKNSVVDFDDMLHLVVRRFRVDTAFRDAMQRQFDHVLMDESQDTNTCHPPGTLVRRYLGYKGKKAITEDVPIETLVAGDSVVAWRRRWGKLTAKGSPIKVGKRWYTGNLVEVQCGDDAVQMTPDHRVYAMLNGDNETSYVVYLMWRKGFGFRVGQCAIRYCLDTKHKSLGGVGSRFVEEKADKGWILRVCKTKQESRAWEQITSCKYGIPTTQFESSNGVQHTEFIQMVFSNVTGAGLQCLQDYSLMGEYPLFVREADGTRKLPSKRYFETRAVNLIPGLMSLPSTEDCKQVKVDAIRQIPYSGWVYSLDVDKWHTYVANNIVVRNCQWEFVNYLLAPNKRDFYAVGDLSQSIYAFNGAEPRLLKAYSEGWRGVVPKLYRIAKNHRSLPRIVYLANHIQSKMTGEVIPLKMTTFRGDDETKGTIELTQGSLPLDIAMSIAGEIFKGNARKRDQIPYKENCILVRSARQVPDIESALVRHRIPYQVRGGRGLLQTEEIRDVLSYLRLATNPKDFTALARAVTVPKTGAGDVTLEKIRKTANDKFDGDLIKGCTSIDKLSPFVRALEYIQKFGEYPVQALEKIIDYTNYKTYLANKYKKEPDKVKSKLENIERFKELVRGLSEDQKMTTDDVVFQLTLDRAREDDKDGMVTVSTIHSAKGLEWSRVFLTNVTEGSIPHRFSMGSESEIEEEKRLLYVACTRARDHLTLCVHAMEQNEGNTRRVTPSRFLVELGLIEA